MENSILQQADRQATCTFHVNFTVKLWNNYFHSTYTCIYVVYFMNVTLTDWQSWF